MTQIASKARNQPERREQEALVINSKIGLLTIIEITKGYTLSNKKIPKKCICKCNCGNLVSREWRTLLRRKFTSSCGCLKSKIDSERTTKIMTVHGHTRKNVHSAEYNSWHTMLSRCYNIKAPNYLRYGGRGIFVCERWKNSFINFLQDMGERPKPKQNYSLDRINNEGFYEPSNCRWATALEQARNKTKATIRKTRTANSNQLV